jgi:hypothetical protein
MGMESRSGDALGLLGSPRQQQPEEATFSSDWATSWGSPPEPSASFGPIANTGPEPVLLPIR